VGKYTDSKNLIKPKRGERMPICPNCNCTIDHLIGWDRVCKMLRYRIKNGMDDLEEVKDWCNAPRLEFQCPKCQKTLFHTPESARFFLAGKSKE